MFSTGLFDFMRDGLCTKDNLLALYHQFFFFFSPNLCGSIFTNYSGKSIYFISFCPQVPISQTEAKLSGRSELACCDCMNALCNVEYFNRRRIREIAKIPAAPCEDFCLSFFCFPFAICQDARETALRLGAASAPGANPGMGGTRQ